MRRREGDLFDLGEVVLWVTIQRHLADTTQWDFRVRPDFCDVENVPAEGLGLFGCKNLAIHGPGRIVGCVDV